LILLPITGAGGGSLELERRKLQQELYTSQERVSTLKETLTAEETEKKKVQGMLEATRKEVESWEENDREIIINWAKKCMALKFWLLSNS